MRGQRNCVVSLACTRPNQDKGVNWQWLCCWYDCYDRMANVQPRGRTHCALGATVRFMYQNSVSEVGKKYESAKKCNKSVGTRLTLSAWGLMVVMSGNHHYYIQQNLINFIFKGPHIFVWIVWKFELWKAVFQCEVLTCCISILHAKHVLAHTDLEWWL